jgi:hypothetical protein
MSCIIEDAMLVVAGTAIRFGVILFAMYLLLSVPGLKNQQVLVAKVLASQELDSRIPGTDCCCLLAPPTTIVLRSN